MTTMIERNNELRQKLTAENRQYYEEILVYMRTKPKMTEAVLLEILEDILEAQENGENARQYFGADPKATADELLEQLEQDKLVQRTVGCYVIFLVTLFKLMTPEFNLVEYVIEVVGVLALCKLFFYLLGIDAFERYKWRSYLGAGLAIAVFLALYLGSDFFTPASLIFPLGPASLGVIWVLGLLYGVLAWKWPELFKMSFSIIGMLIAAGTLAHLPISGNFFSGHWGQGLLLLVLISFFGYRTFKTLKK